MRSTINTKELRASLPEVVSQVRKGARFTVLYRSRPAFQIVPVGETSQPRGALQDDPLYHSSSLGRSRDGRTAADHDPVIYRQ